MLRHSFAFLIVLVIATTKADLNIVKKADWLGLPSSNPLTSLQAPISRVIIAHTAGADCHIKDECSSQVRNIQVYQMEKLHFDDIAYNFLIGNDGNVYEGRGWDYQGAFARGFNAASIGIAFIGQFHENLPERAALDSAKLLLEAGVTQGKISSEYKLFAHRQVTATESPGLALYKEVTQWPHWTSEWN